MLAYSASTIYLVSSRWLIVSELRLRFFILRRPLLNVNFEFHKILFIRYSSMIFLFNEFYYLTLIEKKKEIWLLTISLETACKDEISSDG